MTDAIQIPRPPHIPAAVVSWVVFGLGAAGIMDRWGLTADDVAALLGFALGAVATAFAVIERRCKGDTP